jgi:hypothetical protein
MARATASSSRSSNDRSSAACKKALGAFIQAKPFQEAGVEPTVHDRLIKIRDSGDNSGEEREMGDASTGDVGFRMGANDKFIGIESISFGQLVLLLTTANGGYLYGMFSATVLSTVLATGADQTANKQPSEAQVLAGINAAMQDFDKTDGDARENFGVSHWLVQPGTDRIVLGFVPTTLASLSVKQLASYMKDKDADSWVSPYEEAEDAEEAAAEAAATKAAADAQKKEEAAAQAAKEATEKAAADVAAKQAQRALDVKRNEERKRKRREQKAAAHKKQDTKPDSQVRGGKGGDAGGKSAKELPAKIKVSVVDVSKDEGGSSAAPIRKKARVSGSGAKERSTVSLPLSRSRSSSPKARVSGSGAKERSTVSLQLSRSRSSSPDPDRTADKGKGRATDITRQLEAFAKSGGKDSAFAKQSQAHAQVCLSVCGLFGRLQSGLRQVRDAGQKLDYAQCQLRNAQSVLATVQSTVHKDRAALASLVDDMRLFS